MRIMLDTNVLISALVFRGEHLTRVIEKVVEQDTLVLCSYVIDEINTVVERKFPKHKSTMDKFLSRLSFELVYSPKEIEGAKLFEIRDDNDYIILHTAIIEDIDILITGDKDFAAVDIERPEILTPSEYLAKY
ncbi:putative toxin-antitoxin system toxin component, PIN family [Syntrophomonas wolfei]|uniref:putative toxin-antitoxin system toxin component, PIN family n=1 Tax=Syntrophomonas wolfei TaxID=863 RepID=UPI0023F06965|nr:putative toxin-antitoxin system toxin component, PIN family [Syntrophomonas wolfei]